MPTRRFHPTRPAATALACGLLLVLGCAGRAPKPGSSLTDAEAAVTKAEQGRVGDYDATDLRSAKESLTAARAAAADPDAKNAKTLTRWLAARAQVDAELGLARSELARLKALTLSVQRDIDARQTPPVVVIPAQAPGPVPPPTTEH